MKIKRAIILGAGYGTRLRPITLKIPKPLIKINGVTLLENSIKLLSSLGVKHIIVNAYYLHKEIIKFVKGKKFSFKIDVTVEKKKILNTGGGILNASKKFKKQPFFVLNPDTLWDLKKYKKEFRKLEKLYFKNKKPTMLLVSKKKSFDRSFKGDFNLNSKNEILREKNNKFIFIGAQIINRSVFKKRKIKPFSMNKVWDDLIKNKALVGVVSRQKIFHKKNSYDQSFNGDFNINSKKEILRQKNNRFIFTGAQIIDRSIFKKRKIKPFSINQIWDELIKNKNLLGVLSGNKFFHINNYKIYKKLNKKVIG